MRSNQNNNKTYLKALKDQREEDERDQLSLAASMTKREQFAAMAMQGLLSSRAGYQDPDEVALDARIYADALLAELAKEKGE